MTLEECYNKMGANYLDTMKRIDNEKLITMIVKSFPQDNSYQILKDGLANKDIEVAFRGAHTLKGICLNLGFDQLSTNVCSITEILRAKSFDGTDELFSKITDTYNNTCNIIKELD